MNGCRVLTLRLLYGSCHNLINFTEPANSAPSAFSHFLFSDGVYGIFDIFFGHFPLGRDGLPFDFQYCTKSRNSSLRNCETVMTVHCGAHVRKSLIFTSATDWFTSHTILLNSFFRAASIFSRWILAIFPSLLARPLHTDITCARSQAKDFLPDKNWKKTIWHEMNRQRQRSVII